jgi:HEAT repeat protein
VDEARIRDAIRRLDDPWKPMRNQAAQELFEAGESVIPYMKEILLAEVHDPDLAHYAVWVLETLDTAECEAILEEYWERHG